MGEYWISDWTTRVRAVLRPCVSCGDPFLSMGPGFRFCRACIRKEADARARPFSRPQEEIELIEFIEESFDPDAFNAELNAFRARYEAQRAQERSRRSARYRRLRANG
jgi:ribosomal protein S14